MTTPFIAQRKRAASDIDEAIAAYRDEAGADVALGFVDALESVYALLLDHPHLGSPRYSHELNIPGLRHRRLNRYPWLVFYIARPDHIEIVRVLDARRDIPAWLAADEAS